VPPEPAEARIAFSLVIPTYNEAKNIGPLLERLDALLRPALDDSFELIVVDDDSPDGTSRTAAEIALRIPSVRVVTRRGERGLATAIIRGWQVARGDVLGVIDADLQHPPETLLPLLAQIGRGADLAVGSRNVVGGGVSDWSLARRMLSRGAQLIGLLILPEVLGRLTDPMSGLFLVRRAALAGVEMDPLGYKILIEVVGRSDIRWIAEVPYVFRERVAGESKVSFRLYREYLLHLIKLRLKNPSHSPFLRYLLVGTLAFLVDMALLYALSEQRALGWGIARSKLVSGFVALSLSFPAHEFWSFRHTGLPRGRGHFKRRLLAFIAVSATGLLGATLALSVLVQFAGLNRYFANAVGIMLVGGWNYLLHRQITWTKVPVRETRELAPPPPPSLSITTIEKLMKSGKDKP